MSAPHSDEFVAPDYQSSVSHVMPPETWVLVLNRYQRDNLLWLMQVCGYGHSDRHVAPFHLAHTGDWLGEIHNMLGSGRASPSFDPQRPNRSVEDLRAQVEQWVATTYLGSSGAAALNKEAGT